MIDPIINKRNSFLLMELVWWIRQTLSKKLTEDIINRGKGAVSGENVPG